MQVNAQLVMPKGTGKGFAEVINGAHGLVNDGLRSDESLFDKEFYFILESRCRRLCRQ